MKLNLSVLFPLFFLFLLSFSERVKSQPNTLYFMKGIPQTKDLNPARPGISDGFYISMPGFSKIDLSANTNNWSYSDLIHPGTGLRADSLVLDLNKFTSAIGKSNFISESAGLTLLEGGLKSGKNFFALSLSEKEFAEFYFHKNLINLLNYGNFPYLGTTFNSGTFGLNAQHYRELAFNFSRELNKKFSTGITAKILFGLGAIHTNGLKLKGTSPLTGDFLDVTASGKTYLSAPVTFTYSSSDLIRSAEDNFEASSYLNNYSNPGLALDLGISCQINKKLQLSASLIDLGLISWHSNTTQFTEQGHYLYRGVNISNRTADLESIINDVGDSIRGDFKLRHSEKGFSTFLPLKLYMGGEYILNDKASVGGLVRIRASGNTIHSSFTASANVLVWNSISLSGSYSVMESTFDNLGAGVGFRAGPVQVYALSDNIFSPFHLTTARNMNLRVGINFIFNDRQRENKGKTSEGEIRGKRSKRDKKDCGCPY